jgi:chemotaxis protein MotB
MPLRRRGHTTTLDAWPGYVDALSTLLMVVMFVLLVFVLAQAFLSVSLSGKDTELQRLNAQIAQLSDMLSLEKSRSADLTLSLAGLNKAVQDAQTERDGLRQQLAAAQTALAAAQTQASALHDQTTTLFAQLSDAQTEAKSAATRMQALQTQAAAAAGATDTIAANQAQIKLLNQQLAQLRLQLASVSAALDLSKTSDTAKTAQIKDLTTRLNLALANRVQQLERYRSEFFGKLREVLKNVPGVSIVGDRFVFQSEVLFPVGSADLSGPGEDQLRKLATTLLQISKQIPPGLHWILRVDGHADRQQLSGTGQFKSNWELSAERAINVVRFLIAQGVPATRLAATAFGDTQPIAPGGTQADYARNRRIELRLTDR